MICFGVKTFKRIYRRISTSFYKIKTFTYVANELSDRPVRDEKFVETPFADGKASVSRQSESSNASVLAAKQ